MLKRQTAKRREQVLKAYAFPKGEVLAVLVKIVLTNAHFYVNRLDVLENPPVSLLADDDDADNQDILILDRLVLSLPGIFKHVKPVFSLGRRRLELER